MNREKPNPGGDQSKLNEIRRKRGSFCQGFVSSIRGLPIFLWQSLWQGHNRRGSSFRLVLALADEVAEEERFVWVRVIGSGLL